MILPATDENLRRAAAAVADGSCIVFPTDTVYGIAADPFQPAAVSALLGAKHRQRDMPPPVLIAEPAMLAAVAASVDETLARVVDRFWPGPLTVIVKAQQALNMDLGETFGTIAVRVPNDEVARALLRVTGPLAVSSANISGEPPATTASQANAMLKETVALYLDDGPRATSEVSTIVDLASQSSGVVLRLGAISLDELREVLPSMTMSDQ